MSMAHWIAAHWLGGAAAAPMPDVPNTGSILADVAAAVTAEINANTWTPTITAVRRYLPEHDLKEMNTLHVNVIPALLQTSRKTRGAIGYRCTVDVAVQQRVDPDDLDTLDAMEGLVEAIERHFDGATLSVGTRKATCVAINDGDAERSQGRGSYYYPHMSEMRQFTAVTRLVWQVIV